MSKRLIIYDANTNIFKLGKVFSGWVKLTLPQEVGQIDLTPRSRSNWLTSHNTHSSHSNVLEINHPKNDEHLEHEEPTTKSIAEKVKLSNAATKALEEIRSFHKSVPHKKAMKMRKSYGK